MNVLYRRSFLDFVIYTLFEKLLFSLFVKHVDNALSEKIIW